MTGTAQRFAQATEFFGGHVHAASAGSWSAPTPCTDWNVHDLVNHVVNEQLWARPLIEGRTIAEIGDQFDGDLLGPDPAGAWDRAAQQSRSALGAPGAQEQTVHLSYGDETAENYTSQMALDALVHGWDLACGIGADRAMPPELVSWAIEMVEPMIDSWAASGLFGSQLSVDEDADEQTRLLALLGRSVHWPSQSAMGR